VRKLRTCRQAYASKFLPLFKLKAPLYVKLEIYWVLADILKVEDIPLRYANPSLIRFLESAGLRAEIFEDKIIYSKKERFIRIFREAWKRRNHVLLGILLGYPICCTIFYLLLTLLGSDPLREFDRWLKKGKSVYAYYVLRKYIPCIFCRNFPISLSRILMNKLFFSLPFFVRRLIAPLYRGKLNREELKLADKVFFESNSDYLG